MGSSIKRKSLMYKNIHIWHLHKRNTNLSLFVASASLSSRSFKCWKYNGNEKSLKLYLKNSFFSRSCMSPLNLFRPGGMKKVHQMGMVQHFYQADSKEKLLSLSSAWRAYTDRVFVFCYGLLIFTLLKLVFCECSFIHSDPY